MKTKQLLTAVCLVAGLNLLPVTFTPLAHAASNTPGEVGQVVRTSQLMGQNISNNLGHSLGKVSNVIVDLNSGRILFVVVDAAGGKPGDRFGIPGDKFTAGSNPTQPVANVTKDQLSKGPKFAGGEAVIANLSYAQQVYSYYGSPAWFGGGANASFGNNVHDAKQLSTAKINSSSGQQLGQVKDLVLDPAAERVLYVIMAPASGAASANFYPIPPMAFTKGSKGSLATGLTTSSLQGAPSLPANHWPDVASTSYAQQVYQFYGKQPYFSGGPAAPAINK